MNKKERDGIYGLLVLSHIVHRLLFHHIGIDQTNTTFNKKTNDWSYWDRHDCFLLIYVPGW